MKSTKYRSGLFAGVLLPVGLICLFAFSSLALALLGGRAYRQINANIDDGYGSTVAVSYLRTKLAQNNRAGAISLQEIDGLDVLVIASTVGERTYETRIFVYDNTLRESFVAAGQTMDVTNSVEIAQISSCTFTIGDDGLFEAEIVSTNGVSAYLAFALVLGGGA